MSTYAELTDVQKKILADHDLAMRPLIGEMARLVDKASAVAAAYAELAGPILNDVTNTELIPNTSSLAGSVDLQVYDTGVLMGYLSALVSGWDSAHRDLSIKAVGALNTVGS